MKDKELEKPQWLSVSLSGEGAEIDAFPWLRNIPGLKQRYDRIENKLDNMKRQTIGNRVDEMKVSKKW